METERELVLRERERRRQWRCSPVHHLILCEPRLKTYINFRAIMTWQCVYFVVVDAAAAVLLEFFFFVASLQDFTINVNVNLRFVSRALSLTNVRIRAWKRRKAASAALVFIAIYLYLICAEMTKQTLMQSTILIGGKAKKKIITANRRKSHLNQSTTKISVAMKTAFRFRITLAASKNNIYLSDEYSRIGFSLSSPFSSTPVILFSSASNRNETRLNDISK